MAVESFLGTRPQRAFMLTIALQAVVVLAMIAIIFNKVEDHTILTDQEIKSIPCYLALFVLAELFELVIAWDSLRSRNTVQLVAILIFHASLVVFASLQAYEMSYSLKGKDFCTGPRDFDCDDLWRRIKPYAIVTPCAISISWFIMMFFARALYYEFGWAIFHVVGASPTMKIMYQYYQILICFLKFDFFFFTGVTIQLLIVVLAKDSAEFGITIAAVPIVLVLLVMCSYAVKREIKWLMSISLALMMAAESYFVFKLYRIFSPGTQEQYSSTRTTLTFFIVIAFIILFATFGVGLRNFADFDKGLITSKLTDVHLGRNKTGFGALKASIPAQMEAADRQAYFAGGQPLQPRISIE